jgi:hypothetical protein
MKLLSGTRNQHGSLAEFGPVLFIFFVIIFFPLIGLFTFADGMATLAFCSSAAARSAASAATRQQAAINMKDTGSQLIGKDGKKAPLAAFANLTPGDNSGLTLTVCEIGNDGEVKKSYNYNEDIPKESLENGVFQYQVTASYNVAPLFFPINPLMSFTGTAVVEHPEGLNDHGAVP